MERLAWGALVVVAACSGGSETAIDAADPDAPPGCLDCDAMTFDAAIDSPATCASLVYTTRPVEAVRLFDDGVRLNAARSFRVAIEYDATPCDQLAMPSWRVSAADHVVRVEANVFASSLSCPGLPMRRTRVVTLRLDEGTWRVLGTGAINPPSLSVTVGPRPGTPCGGAGSCAQDCDCASGEACLAGIGLGGPFSQCARPCELDRDCGGDGRCASVEDGLQLTCDDGQPECGDIGSPACPAGFTCASGACTPDFQLSGTTRHECACDADCDAPLRCVQSDIPGRVARCELACPTGGAWCTGLHACGTDDTLAPSDSVCGFLGE